MKATRSSEETQFPSDFCPTIAFPDSPVLVTPREFCLTIRAVLETGSAVTVHMFGKG